MASSSPVIVVGGNNGQARNSAGPSGVGGIKKRLFNVENVTQAVLWVGLAALAAVIVSSCALVIDQMHFNNQTYRDQSDKTSLQMEALNTRIDALQKQLEQQAATQSSQ